jgi:hypothetical protein
VADIAGKDVFSMYPNPVTTEIHVKLAQQETADYILYNIAGQAVMQGKVRNSSIIDVQTLSSGIYLVRMITAEWETTQKIIKQ